MDNFNPSQPRASRPAPTVFCYICGRQFGSKSIDIHLPQCLKKWHAENDKLPKNQRRAAPTKPDDVIVGGVVDREATNEALWKSSQGLMLECEHCGRRFKEDRLPVHQRSCTADNPAKRLASKSRERPNK
ncbi:hypothetical protein PRIPAC_70463 [Pristionchus pacificus]|uniref:Uncharacterized protein n=1 Tax=Pristionchus pacificus TaxID=54126 RepID=A0A2A6C6A9_PRIPA|nr:hypothetical protein PRIPAC_70463 [Pristionchus pacificus]|eukprot:PDM73689.1 hypothetical protein PRIPAC_41045 [Pristionchus pacificus]